MVDSAHRAVTCILLGGGGHARVLIDCLRTAKVPDRLVILDADRSRWGQELLGVPIRGDVDLLPDLVAEGAGSFVVSVGSVGDTSRRRTLFGLGLSHGLEPRLVKHATACCSRWGRLGRGVQLLPGSIVNAGAVLGDNVIVNSGAIVEHDCSLGEHVHVATGARLAGGVEVGSDAHIGAGATVKELVTIGAGALVGAGAVVVDDVAPGTVVVGVPARPLASGAG